MDQPQQDSLALGIDVGGTKIKAALVDSRGQIVESNRQPTNADQGPDRGVETIVRSARKLLESASTPVETVGVGIAGQVNKTEGILLSSPNLKWEDVPLKRQMEGQLGLPVSIANDATAATWGEWQHGAARDQDDFLCIFLGTGVGTGVVTSGRMLEASHGPASELGHVPLVFNGRECSCPHRGCLEAYTGGWAIAERAREKVEQDSAAGKLLVSLAGTREEITAKHLAQAFRQNDPLACQLVEETGQYLGAAMVGMVNTFNPCLLVFGGGVSEGLPELLALVEETVRRHAFSAFVQDFGVTQAALGTDAGVVGAAALGRAQREQAD